MKTIRRATLAFLWIMILPSLLLAAPTIPGFYGTIAPALRTVSPTQLPVLKPGGMRVRHFCPGRVRQPADHLSEPAPGYHQLEFVQHRLERLGVFQPAGQYLLGGPE